MKVKLISYSQPQDALKVEGLTNAQELIAFCARVSNPTNQMNMATSDKLIRYLVKHKHWSPLEMVSVCLEIETTRDIARQILRHRSFSFQEFSQRYADPTQHLEFVTREARLQDDKNRQNSIKLADDPQTLALKKAWDEKQQAMISLAKETYTWAIQQGIAKEQARAVLPEGLTMSRLYMNGTLRSWVHYLELRSGNGTQLEHMEVAIACAQVIAKVFPLMDELIREAGQK
ncbi:MAG: FAD-dependent thymidylate synthase [Bacilli bacterium]